MRNENRHTSNRNLAAKIHASFTPAALALAATLLFSASSARAQAQMFTVIHAFNPSAGDGSAPIAGVVRDPSGNLYGTTSGGGTSGNGTVYKIDSSGTETVLLSFNGANGSYPVGH